MTDWTIEPNVGVGAIKFGMSPAEVAAILGPPSERRNDAEAFATQPDLAKEFKDSVTEYRKLGKNPDPVIQYKSDKVVGIDFPKNQPVSLDGKSLFDGKRQAVIDDLIDKSQNVFESFEGYVFLDFGIAMSNAENFRTNANINVFSKGTFDFNIKDMLQEDLGEFIKGGHVK